MKKEPLQWPDDMGESLPDIWVDDLLEAALTFPNETGLGWDRLHPKVVCRLSRALVLDLVRIMIICEQVGEWPDNVALVLIALLAKPTAGIGPLGWCPSCRGFGCGAAKVWRQGGKGRTRDPTRTRAKEWVPMWPRGGRRR